MGIKLKLCIEQLQKSLRGTIQLLAMTAESKDCHAIGHQRRVACLACCIAEEMSIPKEQADIIRLAALLHDIGKVSLPLEILGKPGRLTMDEFSMVKGHPQVGYDILKDIESLSSVSQIVLQHHERIDGSGYPLGLSGDDILSGARILGVSDVVDAMPLPDLIEPPLVWRRH